MIKFLDKKTLIEAAVIVVASSLLGLAYNFYSSKPLPLIKQEQLNAGVSENELLGGIDTTKTAAAMQPASKDTIPKAIENKSKNEEEKLPAKEEISTTTKDSKEQSAAPAPIQIKEIGYKLVDKYKSDNRFLLIDARSAEIYSKGRIGSAINIYPLGDNQDQYFREINTLPRDKAIVIYCDGGACDLSHHLAEDLKNFGYTKIFIYKGGWEEWIKVKGIK
jgi:rhodanese-related sulfurtransferase